MEALVAGLNGLAAEVLGHAGGFSLPAAVVMSKMWRRRQTLHPGGVAEREENGSSISTPDH